MSGIGDYILINGMDFVCPYKCHHRTNSGYCGSIGSWEHCQYRQLYQPNTVIGYVPPLKRTNADRVRSMSDEELAEFLAEYRCAHKAPHCMEANCVQCWLDWLKQEAGECTTST